jgi:nucleotide-binding universal stress UspA family protein
VSGIENSDPRVIIVGADGSAGSVRALRWAADQARQSGAVVRVVTGFDIPATIFVVPTYTEADYGNDARRMLDRTVIEALGSKPDITVEKHLVQKPPKRALVEAASGRVR